LNILTHLYIVRMGLKHLSLLATAALLSAQAASANLAERQATECAALYERW
jgi:hypothetical protein